MKKAIIVLAVLALGIWAAVNFADRLDLKPLSEFTVFTDEEGNDVNGAVADGSADSACDSFCYAFSCLNSEEQKVYNEIYQSLIHCEKETNVSTLDVELIDKAYFCVMTDHPELFYVDGYKYTEYSVGSLRNEMTFSGTYLYDKKEIAGRRKQIDEAVREVIGGAPVSNDDYVVVKYVFDWIVSSTVYDLNAVDSQNICSVFLNHRSVCRGYAKAFQYLLNQLDIDTSIVSGTVADGERHSWNLVRMNGQWYYMDVTWGDACYWNCQEKELQEYNINYDYFGVTTEQLLQTHTIDMPIEMPDCHSLNDHYYVRENAYFYAYDEKKIEALFQKAYQNGTPSVTIK